MRPRKMPTIDKYLREEDQPILSTESSHEGLFVPNIISQYGDKSRKIKDMIPVFPKMFGSLYEIHVSAKKIKKNPYLSKTKIDQKTLEELEAYAKSIGVNHIGYTKVNPDYIFKNKKILFENAIVITMEMKKDAINQAPSAVAQNEIFRTYHNLGVIVNKLSKFLRKRGFNSQGGPALGGEVNYVMLARDAGIGEIGKHGLLITEDFGPSLRIAAVYTDIENLPFSEDNPHTWISDFCSQCNACVKKCPSQAIYSTPKLFEDGSHQHIDYKKCAVPFSNDYGCTLCVKNCTFYKGNYQKIKEQFHGNL